MAEGGVGRSGVFGVDALPYGVFAPPGEGPRVGVRWGDAVVDLAALAEATGQQRWASVFRAASLNPFLALGRQAWVDVRGWLQQAVVDEDRVATHRHDLADVRLALPIEVADYVDFYASEHHAANVGRILRPGSEPLTPNYKHLPIGYHGRAGTVVVSGTDVVRPRGQLLPPGAAAPEFGPSGRLDLECELGFVVGRATGPARPVTVDEYADHLFGVVILNDWSARDIQAWEYVPLGPFLGKSFATSISAWVLPYEALAAAVIPLPDQRPEPLPYLRGDGLHGLDVHLQVAINGAVVARPEFRDIYWSPAQLLAHLTVNGASTRVGDLLGSGTVSGAEPERRGSLLELSWGGTEPIRLSDGSERSFLADGDTVVISGWAAGPAGSRVGLGEVAGTIRAAQV